MIDIQCDHVKGWRWPFVWQCKAKAAKHLLHHPKWGYGNDPQVLLLCDKHHQMHIELAVKVTVKARVEGHPLQLSHIIKDTGEHLMDVEELFITRDGAVFRMIEDEWGDLFWGYGHRQAPEFIGEVNGWLRHVGIFEDELVEVDHPVDHVWAQFDNGNDGYFTLVEPHTVASFPVTRLML